MPSKEEKQWMKVLVAILATLFFFFIGLAAVAWIGDRLDERPAARPSEWR